MRKSILAVHIALALLMAVAFLGCPRPEQATKVYVLINAADDAKALKAELPVGEIESLTVTVTEIELSPADETGEEQLLFTGSMDVNLFDLTDISQVLSSAEVAPGTYGQIRLEIENPRLVLKADPETVITDDIQLTANGHLFISGEFEISEGESQLLVLGFGGIHLVETGNGKYVLTPQLRADLEVSDAAGLVVGPIASADTDSMVVMLEDGTTVDVDISAAVIYLPTDTDTPTGTIADLVVDAVVQVEGLFSLDGTLAADVVRIQPAAPPAP
ncbi:MAG: DUF4382 domain-containing protein [FCB group bacterium]|jgi:hypothetical protein|nr:DUF4382 domain-containing protein [FCB group bacterium]